MSNCFEHWQSSAVRIKEIIRASLTSDGALGKETQIKPRNPSPELEVRLYLAAYAVP